MFSQQCAWIPHTTLLLRSATQHYQCVNATGCTNAEDRNTRQNVECADSTLERGALIAYQYPMSKIALRLAGFDADCLCQLLRKGNTGGAW